MGDVFAVAAVDHERAVDWERAENKMCPVVINQSKC